MAEVPAPRTDPENAASVALACRDFVELVTDYLEGALPAEVERTIAAHLALCEPCVEYLEQIRRTTDLLGTLPVPSLPPAVRAELLAVHDELRATRGDG